jgi:uncharacterized protein YjbJ (UPF0337 family)
MRHLPLLPLAASLAALPGCGAKQEPIDRARDAVDDALDRRPAEKLRDAAEDATAAVREAADDAKDAAAEMTDEAKKALEDAAR